MIEQFQQGNRYYGAIEIAGTGNFSGTSQRVRSMTGPCWHRSRRAMTCASISGSRPARS